MTIEASQGLAQSKEVGRDSSVCGRLTFEILVVFEAASTSRAATTATHNLQF
jgi:hypothetical protein